MMRSPQGEAVQARYPLSLVREQPRNAPLPLLLRLSPLEVRLQPAETAPLPAARSRLSSQTPLMIVRSLMPVPSLSPMGKSPHAPLAGQDLIGLDILIAHFQHS